MTIAHAPDSDGEPEPGGEKPMQEIGKIDRFQRRHSVVGFPIAVVYKYFDDQGAYLAAIITYYAFIAIFPLLLISSSVLGFFLQDDPVLQERLLNSALSQFPIVGDALGRPDGLTGSTSAIVLGILTAVYGAMGLGQACQNAANVAWSVPRNSRANPFLMRLRSILFLSIGGFGVLTIAVLSSAAANNDQFGSKLSGEASLLIKVVGFALTVIVFMGLFRLVSGRRDWWKSILPGSVFTAGGWQLLQWGGQSYVNGVIAKASQVNATFALVLGLLAFIFLASIIAVLGLELNVVAARRLYPRALMTPFTDNVVLTSADRRAYTGYARSQRHKGFQSVDVRFDKFSRAERVPPETPAADPEHPSEP